MPRIYDNLSAPTQLGAGLNEFLRSFTAIDVATGYFDLRAGQGSTSSSQLKPVNEKTETEL